MRATPNAASRACLSNPTGIIRLLALWRLKRHSSGIRVATTRQCQTNQYQRSETADDVCNADDDGDSHDGFLS